MSTPAEAIIVQAERMAGLIEDGLCGRDVKGWPSPKVSGKSYLGGLCRAISFMDDVVSTRPKSELQIESVLLFRSERDKGGMMLRVVANRGKDRLICFKFGKDSLNLLSMFLYKLGKDDVDWRIDTERVRKDSGEAEEGFLPPL